MNKHQLSRHSWRATSSNYWRPHVSRRTIWCGITPSSESKSLTSTEAESDPDFVPGAYIPEPKKTKRGRKSDVETKKRRKGKDASIENPKKKRRLDISKRDSNASFKSQFLFV